MIRNSIIILVLIAVAAFFFIQAKAPSDGGQNNGGLLPLPQFSPPALNLPGTSSISKLAWQTFQKYLGFAKNHDLEGVKSLSHQISPTCANPAQKAQCDQLMDSVANLSTIFVEADFNHNESDSKQIILYTDGPDRAFLYFTRTETGDPRVLGLKVCAEENATSTDCVLGNANKKDTDSDGWWDSVEALFYK